MSGESSATFWLTGVKAAFTGLGRLGAAGADLVLNGLLEPALLLLEVNGRYGLISTFTEVHGVDNC